MAIFLDAVIAEGLKVAGVLLEDRHDRPSVRPGVNAIGVVFKIVAFIMFKDKPAVRIQDISLKDHLNNTLHKKVVVRRVGKYKIERLPRVFEILLCGYYPG